MKHLKTAYIFILLVLMSLIVMPVMATDTDLSVTYYSQETDYYCGPAVAQMWIDYHNSFVTQENLYNFIQSHNIESGWATDPQGLEDCIENYISNIVADDHKWSSADSAIMGQAVDIVNRGIPSASLIYEGGHWNLMKGVSYSLYGGQIYQINGVWIHDPWYTMSPDIYYTVNLWKNEFTQVDITSSTWDNYWVTVQGYWESRSRPDYEKETENIRFMDDSEVSEIITKDTDVAAFAREQMDKHGLFQEELKETTSQILYVYSLDENYPDYYLVSFEKSGVPVVISRIIIKDDTIMFGACAAPNGVSSAINPTLEEAEKVFLEEESESLWNSRLVWKPCEQTMSEFMPVWEFSNAANETKYVGYDQFKQQIVVYDELTSKKIMG